MTHPIRTIAAALFLLAACRTTVDTSATLTQVVDTRHGAEVVLRSRGEPRCLVRLGQEVWAGEPLGDEWYAIPYTEFGALPTVAFDGEEGVLVMTGDVVVGGTRNEPEVQQVTRLWRAGADGRDELLFETTDVILGSFARLSDGYVVAVRYDDAQPDARQYGSALVRLEDEEFASVSMTDFEAATLLRVDPADGVPVVLGERRAGDGREWGVFRLEGVERRPVMWESQVVAPSFSRDGRRVAYAWKSDREAARSGRGVHDGPFERLTVVDRETGSGQHLDTGVDIVATSFDPRDRARVVVLGRDRAGAWELIVVERATGGLRVAGRGAFPPGGERADWRKRLPE